MQDTIKISLAGIVDILNKFIEFGSLHSKVDIKNMNETSETFSEVLSLTATFHHRVQEFLMITKAQNFHL